MLPKGWTWVKLGRMGKLTQGGTPSTDVEEFWNGKIPFITGADVTNLFVANDRSYLTERGIDSGKTQKCEKGDLLIVSRTRVGRIGIAATTLGISQDVSAIKLKERYHNKYIAIYLSSLPKYLQESSQGAIIKGLTRDFLDNLEIPVPPTIDDQLTIANKLEKKAINILEMRQAALRQKEAAEALQGAILRDEFEAKRDNWYPTSISKIADITMGQSPDGDTYNKDGIGIPLLNGPTEFGPNNPTPVQWTNAAKKLGQVGDLLVCVRGNTTGKMNWADQVYCLGRGVASIRGKKEKGDTLFIWYLSIEEIRKRQYDLKATNENAPDTSDKRTPAELTAIIKEAQKQIKECLRALEG